MKKLINQQNQNKLMITVEMNVIGAKDRQYTTKYKHEMQAAIRLRDVAQN